MAIKRIIGKAITKRVAKGGARTAAQKAALKKAVAASARARAKGSVAKAASRKAVKQQARSTAIKSTEKLGLKRATRGFKLNGERRVSAANFKGASGRALRKSTYATRLASSRAKYKNASFGNKLKQAAIPSYTAGPLRRRYSDLTLGENVRRNIIRNLKVSAVTFPAFAAGTAAYTGYHLNKSLEAQKALTSGSASGKSS